MTTRRVSLEVVVDDADESRCGAACPWHRGTSLCFANKQLGEWRERERRTDWCLSAAALASADDAVLEAAEMWGRDYETNSDQLERAVYARRKLRGSKSE